MSQAHQSALAQTLQKKQQNKQQGNPQQVKATLQTLLQKSEIREMLIRLRDK